MFLKLTRMIDERLYCFTYLHLNIQHGDLPCSLPSSSVSLLTVLFLFLHHTLPPSALPDILNSFNTGSVKISSKLCRLDESTFILQVQKFFTCDEMVFTTMLFTRARIAGGM